MKKIAYFSNSALFLVFADQHIVYMSSAVFCGLYFLDTNSCHLEMPNHNKRVDYCSMICHKMVFKPLLGDRKTLKRNKKACADQYHRQ